MCHLVAGAKDHIGHQADIFLEIDLLNLCVFITNAPFFVFYAHGMEPKIKYACHVNVKKSTPLPSTHTHKNHP